MKQPEPIELPGNVVVLEPLRADHAAGLLSAAEHDPDTFRYMSFSPLGAGGIDGYMEEALAGVSRGDYVVWAIVEAATGIPIGSTRFGDIAVEHQRLEIGWTWYGAPWRRTACNSETKLLLLTHAFEDLGALRVALKTDLRNERSQRAIERLGAVREGVLRKHLRATDGYMRDTVYYSLLRDEWPPARARLRAALGQADSPA